MVAWVRLTWKTLGGGGGRTSLVAEDSILLPPGPSTDREITATNTLSHPELMERNVAGEEGRALLIP